MKRKTVDQALRSIRDCADEMASSAGDLVHILGKGGTEKSSDVILAEWARASLEGRKRVSKAQRRRESVFVNGKRRGF